MIDVLLLKRFCIIGLACTCVPFGAIAEVPQSPDQQVPHPSKNYQENVDHSFKVMLDEKQGEHPKAIGGNPENSHPAELFKVDESVKTSQPLE